MLLIFGKPTIAESILSLLKQQNFKMMGIGSSPENVFDYLRKYNLNPIVINIQDKEEANGLDMINCLKKLNDIPVLFTHMNPGHNSKKVHGFEWIDLCLDQDVSHKAIIPEHSGYLDITPLVAKPLEKPDYPENNICPLRDETIFVKNNHIYEKVIISDILWIEAHGAYCKLNTIKKELLLCINLSAFQKLVKIPQIVRVHRSYIINLHKVDAFEADYMHINGELIPLGPKYRDCLAKVFPFIEKTGVII